MHKRTWLVWAMAAMWALGAACSDKPKKPKVLVAQGGPAKPELGWRESAEPAERAPIALTASDGSGLELVALHARTVIEDPLAFTELHLTFHNPEPRRREGRFEIALPPQAAISRFAMRVGDRFQEGEVVERRRAQQVYEDFLHRRQDPALLEKDAGNEFAARVFPIEPNADKEIILAYSEELQRSDEPYRLLLNGLPKLRDIKVDVRVGSSSGSGRESSQRERGSIAQLQLYDDDFVPRGDLEVRLPWQKSVALRSDELVLARVEPVLPVQRSPLDGLTVLVDTSASRALGFSAQLQRLGALLAALREAGSDATPPRSAGAAPQTDFPLRVVAFDQDSAEVYRGPASGFGLREQSALLARGALGATDLAQALAFVARGADKHARVLLVGDGVVTAGADDTTALREAVARLAAHGVQRLDALGEGGIRDLESLTALTRAGLPATGVVLDARAPAKELADKLLRATVARVEVHVAGASWVYPRVLEGLQSGDQRLVYAELPAGSPLQIELVGAGIADPQLQDVPRPLLERAWARAKIEALSSELRALPPDAGSDRAQLETEIVALSRAQRVLSDFTALLVLETEEDYRRFGIDQKALTNILRVGDEGIELVNRDELAPKEDQDRLKVAKRGGWDEERFEAPPDVPTEAPAAVAADPEPQAIAEGAAVAAAPGGPPADGDRDRLGGAPRSRSAAQQPMAEPPPAAERNAAKEEDKSDRASRGTLGGLEKAKDVGAGELARDPAAAQGKGRSADGFAPPPPASRPAPAAPAPAKPAREAEASSRGLDDALATGDLSGSARGGGGLGTGMGTTGSSGASLERRAPPSADAMPIATAPVLVPRVTVRLHSAFGLPQPAAAQALRSGLTARARSCYERAAVRNGSERLALELQLSEKGTVADAYVTSGHLADGQAQSCVLAAARALRFPKPEGGRASVSAGVELALVEQAAQPLAGAPRPPRPRAPARIPTPALEEAYEGALADVLAAVARGDRSGALARAGAAHDQDPGDVIGLIALGEALEAQQDYPRAARAYGSLIDLFPSRADLRRMAAGRLERLPSAGLPLAVDSYRRAVEQRPDQPSGARSLAYALWKNGDRPGAFAALQQALARGYRSDRFEGVDRILREDLALIGAAWLRADPAVEPQVRAVLDRYGLQPERAPSLRFVLSWETDANDVDFHIYDGRGGHAYYMKPKLPSGGALYADITSGYGPECFAIAGKARSYPYVLQAHYFSRGPMGYGMGKLQVIEHDGHGGLRFSEHPFAIMKDKAFIELARLRAPLES